MFLFFLLFSFYYSEVVIIKSQDAEFKLEFDYEITERDLNQYMTSLNFEAGKKVKCQVKFISEVFVTLDTVLTKIEIKNIQLLFIW